MGELSERIEACIKDIKSGLCCPRIHGCEQNDSELCLVRQAFDRAALLDAARTEGRGDEPVAWAYEYTNHLKGDRAPGGWLRAVAFEAPSRARVNAGFARNVQPLYASPIREPEISRTVLGEPCTLEACPVGLFIADACDTLGMKTEYHTDKGAVEAYIVESGEFFWGDNPQTVERQRAQIVRPISYADAILNLAPVAKGASQDAELSDEFDRPGRLSDATRHSAEGAADPALSGARGVVAAFSAGWIACEQSGTTSNEESQTNGS